MHNECFIVLVVIQLKHDLERKIMFDIIIIGSGTAGLTAAIYAERALLHTLVFEKEYMSGGQIINTYEVDNYPGLKGITGYDMGVQFKEHAEAMGASFVQEEVTGIRDMGDYKEVLTEENTYQAKAVVLAMGAKHRMLGVPGEAELSGMGVSYCATCDAAFFRDRTVAVVGGSDVAAEDALYLARGCKKVYLIHRRDSLRAAAVLSEQVKNMPNIEILWDTVVDAIQGDEMVENLSVRNVKSNIVSLLPVQGVFIAVGIEPNTEIATNLVDCDEKGYICAGEDGVTSCPGIYVAGDIRTKALRQVITAAADGANVIHSIQQWMAGVGNAV